MKSCTFAKQIGQPRRRFLGRGLLAVGSVAVGWLMRGWAAAATGGGGRVVDAAALSFLRELAEATVSSARVQPGEARGGERPNATGIPLITPGGNYPALWIRDFAMSLDCGVIGAGEILPQLKLIARCQNGAEERRLPSGAIIPPYAVPDHVSLAGGAVFYPGTLSSGDDQGAAPWGPLPPADDQYYFVHIAYALWRDTRDAGFLGDTVEGMALLDRLVRAFRSPTSDPATGGVVATKERRAVGFGFQDSVYLLGAMSFATLLRWRAAKQLAELCRVRGREREAVDLEKIARTIASHLVGVFADPGGEGWLLAATEVGRQPDVWATLFALHLGVLPRRAAVRARRTVAAAVRAPGHLIEYQGAVRHVPADRYYRPDQCWERSVGTVNTYQSGAFWHTPTGWLVQALAEEEPVLARAVCDRCLVHLRENDFRRGGKLGAPWECFGLGLASAQNPVYMTSVTLPLGVLSRAMVSELEATRR